MMPLWLFKYETFEGDKPFLNSQGQEVDRQIPWRGNGIDASIECENRAFYWETRTGDTMVVSYTKEIEDATEASKPFRRAL